jgi:hypothetical protein
MASTENYGILGDAISVAVELSDCFADVRDLGQRSDVLISSSKRANFNP